MLGYSSNTNYVGTLMVPNVSYPFPNVIQPTGSSLGALTGLGQSLSYVDPNYQLYSFWNFSAGIQRQLTSRSALESEDTLSSETQSS